MKILYAFFGVALAALALFGTAPATAQDFNDAVVGYVWADQPSAAAYTPNLDYQFDAASGDVTIERFDTGRYQVTFPGLGFLYGAESNVQITAHNQSSAVHCNSPGSNWNTVTGVRRASVNCYDAAGAPADTQFNLLLIDAGGSNPQVAYAFALNATSASYDLSSFPSAYNGFGSGITAARSGTGLYSMTFPGIGPAQRGHIQVTALSDSGHYCTTRGRVTNEIFVDCFDASGARADVRYYVLFVAATGLVNGLGYAYADQETAASYTPDADYAFNGSGGAIEAGRTGTGVYDITFNDLGGEGDGGNVQVTAYNSDATQCILHSWDPGGPDFSLFVDCRDAGGALVDSEYDVLVVWPNRVPVANEPGAELPSTLQLHAAYPNPFNPSTTLRYDIAEAGNVRIVVYDALGREVAELLNEQQAVGSHEISFDAAGLPTGTYIARLEAGGETRIQRLTLIR